jgi:TP901 family phage tail tape measure protein
MTGSSGLPLVGAEVVLLGMQQFDANFRQVNTLLSQLGTSFSKFGAATAQTSVPLDKLNQSFSAFTAGAASAEKTAASLASRYGATSKAASEYATVSGKLEAATLSLGKAIATPATALGRSSVASREAALASNEAAVATEALSQRLLKASGGASVAGQQYAALSAQLKETSGSLGGLGTAAEASGVSVVGGLAVAAGAIIGLGVASEKAAAQYNAQLASIGAISGATAVQITRLNEVQLNLARNQTQNAVEVEKLSQALVRDGISVEAVNSSVLKAANSMIILSNGELSAGDAAKIQAQAINTFGTTAENAANASTAAVTRSTIGWSGFAAAISTGGALAARSGLSLNQFAAIVGTAGKTMQDGSAIGAGFRQMLQRLADPATKSSEVIDKYRISLYDANGATRPFVDILKSLEDAFGPVAIASGKVTEQQRDEAEASLFGARSVEFLNSLLAQGTQGYEDMLRATNDVNAADIANKTLAPTAAQAKILQNNIGALAIAFGQGLDPAVLAATKSMVGFTQSLDLATVTRYGQAIANVAQALGFIVAHGGGVGAVEALGEQAITSALGARSASQAAAQRAAALASYGTALDQSERHPGGLATTGVPSVGLGVSSAATKALIDAQEKATKINQDFNRAVANETEKTTDQINKLYRNTYEAIARATQENADTIAKINSDAARQIADAQSAETVKKDQETRRAALEQRLKDEDEARKETRQAEDDANKRDTEDRKNALQQQTKDAEDAFKRQQDDEAESNKERLAGVEAEAKDEQRAREEALKGIQDTEDTAAKRRQENEDAALRDRQRDTETALKDIQRIETDALKQHRDDLARSLKADEDAREQSLKNTFEIENKRLDLEHQLQDVVTKDQRDRAQAEYEYQQDIQRGVKESIAQERLQRKLGDIAQATGQARVKIADTSQQTQETLNVQQDQQRRETALRATFDQEQLTQRRAFEATTAKLEADHEAATLALRKKTEAETLKARQATEDETDRVRRVHEEQRNALAETFRKEDLARAQKNEQDEVAFKRRQEDAYSGYRLGLEQAELAAMRLIEDDDAKRRLVREQEDIRIQAQQAQQRLALQKQFDDEDLARRITNIYKERDERIRAANEAFEKQRENLRTQLANEVIDLRTSLAERLDTIRRDYTDKLAELVSSAGSAVIPYVDSIESAMRGALNNVTNSADAATQAIIRAYNAEGQLHVLLSQRPNPAPLPAPPPGSIQNVPNSQALPNTLTPGYQYGGEVPGPFGSPQWVLAHGGERYAGIGMYGNTLTSVLMAESMAQRGIGGSSHVSNQYSYTVHANYGRTQPEGSVRRDLSALVMLTRG